MSKVVIAGKVHAVNEKTDKLHTRHVQFTTNEDTNWTDIVDYAFFLAFREDYWVLDGEDLEEFETE